MFSARMDEHEHDVFSIVQSSALYLEFANVLLPTSVGAIVGWLLLRKLEDAKSEAARYSEFNRKWAVFL